MWPNLVITWSVNSNFTFSVLAQFIMMLYNIVSEKDLKLRQVCGLGKDDNLSYGFPSFCALCAGLEADWTEGLGVLVLMVCSCD